MMHSRGPRAGGTVPSEHLGSLRDSDSDAAKPARLGDCAPASLQAARRVTTGSTLTSFRVCLSPASRTFTFICVTTLPSTRACCWEDFTVTGHESSCTIRADEDE
jgi:hypothetical protein